MIIQTLVATKLASEYSISYYDIPGKIVWALLDSWIISSMTFAIRVVLPLLNAVSLLVPTCISKIKFTLILHYTIKQFTVFCIPLLELLVLQVHLKLTKLIILKSLLCA